MAWTPERDALLGALWADGASARVIGDTLGTTKNAVVGRAHRLGLTPRPSPFANRHAAPSPTRGMSAPGGAAARAAHATRQRAYVSTRGRSGSPSLGGPREAAAAADHPARQQEAAAAGGIGVAPAAASPVAPKGGCKWPLWGKESRPEYRFCEAPRESAGCPYCAEHAAIAYIRAPAAQRIGAVA